MAKRTGIILILIFFTVGLCADNSGTTVESEEVLELKLKEIYLTISPSFKFVLPDASIKLGFRQKLGDTQLDAETEYNYLYNKINYSIQYSIDFFLNYYIKFYDAINFEQIYLQESYIQRNKGFIVGVQTPPLFYYLRLREELKFDNYYFAKLKDTTYVPDTGNTILLISWLELSNGLSRTEIENDFYAAINFVKSISSDISFYNYLFMNIIAEKNFKFDYSMLLFKFQGGYLIEDFSTPIWEVYRSGGFDKLIGYNYDEFQGYYQNFFRVNYEHVINDKIDWEFFWILLKSLKGIMIFDIGCAGSDRDVMAINNYNMAIGLGFKFNFMFRKRTPVLITLAIGQAIKEKRAPVFYFIHEF